MTSATIAIAVALLAGGCTAPAPSPTPTLASPTPTPTATAAPTATASPAPTPSATPASPAAAAPDPADPSTWLIDFAGIGPMTIGTPLAEVQAAIALPVDQCLPNTAWYSVEGGADVAATAADGGLVSAALVEGGGSPAAGHSPTTAEGIGAGSTLAELQSAYPGIGTHPSSVGDYWFVTDGTTFINFRVSDTGVVGAIAVSTFEVPPKEVCG
ncbi:hypothetical protein VD659_02470 [Herbiconiux sp. 11R-BC]